ncbi:MAG: hypothetical protein R3245_10990 [Kiloniellales bacterium]|nr:hypothetical protein [Kiloniellales bacterium]
MKDKIELKAGLGKIRNGVIIGLFCTAVGFWAYFFAEDSLQQREMTAAGLVVLGLALILWTCFGPQRRKVLLILSARGIWFQAWGPAVVPWPTISKCYARGGRLRRFLCLELRDAEAFLASLSEPDRRALENSEMTKIPNLLIAYGAVEGTPAELHELIQGFLDMDER